MHQQLPLGRWRFEGNSDGPLLRIGWCRCPAEPLKSTKPDMPIPLRYKIDLSSWFPATCSSITLGYWMRKYTFVWLYRGLSDQHPMELLPPKGKAKVVLVEPQTIYVSCEPSDIEFSAIGFNVGPSLPAE